jgi:hypothetical protein
MRDHEIVIEALALGCGAVVGLAILRLVLTGCLW